MARFPTIDRQARIQTGGGVAQASAPRLITPRPGVRTPPLTARLISPPIQDIPIDQVGPLIRQQAIKQFGDVLIDTAVTVADRAAKLKAENAYNEFNDEAYKILYDHDTGYMYNRGYDAYVKYPETARKLQELKKSYEERYTGHVSKYLNPAIAASEYDYRKTAASLSTAQFQVAQDDAQKTRIARLSKKVAQELPNMSVEELTRKIDSELDRMYFTNELERQTVRSGVIDSAVQMMSKNTVVPGEDVEPGVLYRRFDMLKVKVDKLNKSLPLDQQARNSDYILQASVRINQDIERRDMQEAKDRAKQNDQVTDYIFSALTQGQPVPEEFVKIANANGILDGRSADYFMRRAETDRAAANKKTGAGDFLTYVDIHSRIVAGEPREAIVRDLLKAVRDDKLTAAEGRGFLNQLTRISEGATNEMSSKLEYMGKRWILTGAIDPITKMPTAATEVENAMYAQFLQEYNGRLDELRRTQSVTPEALTLLFNEMDLKYGLGAQVKNLPEVPIPSAIQGVPRTRKFTSLKDLQDYTQRMTDFITNNPEGAAASGIGPEELRKFLVDSNATRILFGRIEQIKRENENMRDYLNRNPVILPADVIDITQTLQRGQDTGMVNGRPLSSPFGINEIKMPKYRGRDLTVEELKQMFPNAKIDESLLNR